MAAIEQQPINPDEWELTPEGRRKIQAFLLLHESVQRQLIKQWSGGQQSQNGDTRPH